MLVYKQYAVNSNEVRDFHPYNSILLIWQWNAFSKISHIYVHWIINNFFNWLPFRIWHYEMTSLNYKAFYYFFRIKAFHLKF